MLSNKIGTRQDEKQILALWDKSVTATHDFLRREDKTKFGKKFQVIFLI
ncbi:hypothetical protein GCM10025886_13270 [Tetragenococcus halophilus subsp. flandriensis]|nr:hypothetical protein [Tetragenococcus halophilus]GMA08176.1 hypothetical protein GCM10025886_13270 [Tetragenococcus halophilus subsp. flandriensis]